MRWLTGIHRQTVNSEQKMPATLLNPRSVKITFDYSNQKMKMFNKDPIPGSYKNKVSGIHMTKRCTGLL